MWEMQQYRMWRKQYHCNNVNASLKLMIWSTVISAMFFFSLNSVIQFFLFFKKMDKPHSLKKTNSVQTSTKSRERKTTPTHRQNHQQWLQNNPHKTPRRPEELFPPKTTKPTPTPRLAKVSPRSSESQTYPQRGVLRTPSSG